MDRAIPFSNAPGIAWPGIATAAGAAALALQQQLERSQWWPRERILAQQFRQLREVVAHAVANVPYYRNHLQRAAVKRVADLAPEGYLRWPLLRKADVYANERALQAARYPREHGASSDTHTTGSTGVPTRVVRTEAMGYFATGLVLRDHLWHERDFSAKYGALRSRLQRGARPDWWSIETNVAFRTGPMATMSALSDVQEQLDWLVEERPAYLICYPSTLREMVLLSRKTGKRPAGLRQAITITENLPADLREEVAAEWGAKVVDVYSCEEFGTIALQCPEHPHYHVQSEYLYLEVLRDDGVPCTAGEIGRVVITGLHNFAMPLLRYELGDYAEAGEPCPCGRGLPVLKRIVGRTRNLGRAPDGRRFRPFIPFGGWLEIAPIRRIQLVQKALDTMQLRYVMERDLSASEADAVRRLLQEKLGYPFAIVTERVAQIERKPGEKYEDFISEIG